MKTKGKTHSLRNSVFILFVCAIIGLVLTYSTFQKEGKRCFASSTLSFTFDGAARGVAPNGYRFSANDLLNEEIVKAGLDASSLADRYSVEDIQKNLSVRGIYPDDLISQLTSYESLTDTTGSQQLMNSDYHPSSFVVTLYRDFDTTLSQEQLTGLLENILASYKVYFARIYAMGDLDTIETDTFQDLDYFQQLDTLEVNLNQAARYASEMAIKEPTLQIEGKGFSDISLQFEKRVQSEISTLNATMTINSLSKDLDRLYAMYEFQAKELQNQINIQTQRLENLDELITNYGKTGVIYLSTSDSLNKVDEQSSKEYDKLVDERNEVSSQIAVLNNRIETVKNKLERLQINAGEMTEGQKNSSSEFEDKSSPNYGEEVESEETIETLEDHEDVDGNELEITDAVLEQAAATLEEVDESNGSVDLSEASNRRNTAALESGIKRLAEKGNEAIASLAELLHAYNEKKINDYTVRTSAVRFKDTMKSTAFISRAIKVAGPVCAIGLILSLLLILFDKARKFRKI